MFYMVEQSRFEDFITTPSNVIAKEAAFKTVVNPLLSYNPLVIIGERDTGKTHLLWAINNQLGKNNLSDRVWLEEYPVRIQLDYIHRMLAGDLYQERAFDWFQFFLFDNVESLADDLDAWQGFLEIQKVLIKKRKQVVWCWSTSIQFFGPRFCHALKFGNALSRNVMIKPFETVCRKKTLRALSSKLSLDLSEETIEKLSQGKEENVPSIIDALCEKLGEQRVLGGILKPGLVGISFDRLI